MKKLLGLMLAASMVVGSVSVFAEKVEATFTDISDAKYAWAKPYIEEMARSGYIAGYEDNTYRPDNNITKLETIVLFSRAMGAKLPSNEEVVSVALKEYADVIEAADLNFGEEEVAFMLYRGALTEDDVEMYLADDNASLPMTRQEAAAIITKAMCADETAKSEILVDLEYSDATKIDSKYSCYVYYVSENEIMNGMDDGTFAPEGNVSRSQIAAMLYRTVDKMNLYIETVLVPEVDSKSNNITILDDQNEEIKMGYEETTRFYADGKLISDEEFLNSSRAMLTYINGSLVFVDMYERVIDETIKGVYQGASTEDGVTSVTIKPSSQSKAVEYEVLNGAEVITSDGETVTFKQIVAGSYVELELTNDKIVKLTQLNTNKYINDAIVASIDIDDELYLTISHEEEEYDGMTFLLNDEVIVYKNDDIKDLSKIYKGDKINITLEYGKVTKLKAYSNTKTYQGTVSEVSISSEPVVKIKSGGEIMTFGVTPDVKIKVNGVDATLYELRVGDNIKVLAESDTIISIETTSAAATGGTVNGIVETINASKGFIKVDGETIFCKDSTTTFVTSGGEIKTMKNVVEGQNVHIWGVMQNGAYTATLIVIE